MLVGVMRTLMTYLFLLLILDSNLAVIELFRDFKNDFGS